MNTPHVHHAQSAQAGFWPAVSLIVAFVASAVTNFACSRVQDGSDSRCALGLVPRGARCCAPGQSVLDGRCVGRARQCPSGWSIQATEGCVALTAPIRLPAGRFVVGPNDWESEHVLGREGVVPEFWLDATEVTAWSWGRCGDAGSCPAVTKGLRALLEPGSPVTDVTASEAEAYCGWAGGRLPRSDEWLRAAAGENSRRFPWGNTGLVCRRASFGLVRGPCAEGGAAPDWAGSRPDGRSELGLHDLVGNVAEIVRSGTTQFDVRGGSFRSDHAAELKSWSSVPYEGARSDVGFRCAYDRAPEGGP